MFAMNVAMLLLVTCLTGLWIQNGEGQSTISSTCAAGGCDLFQKTVERLVLTVDQQAQQHKSELENYRSKLEDYQSKLEDYKSLLDTQKSLFEGQIDNLQSKISKLQTVEGKHNVLSCVKLYHFMLCSVVLCCVLLYIYICIVSYCIFYVLT